MANVERDNTEMVEVQKIWQNIVEDSLHDRGKDNKRLGVVCWVMGAVIAIMAAVGVYAFDRQQTKYLGQIEALSARNEKLTNDFLEFLNQYDFETITIEGTQDGYGVNQIGGGNVTNGADGQNSNPEDETQGRTINGDDTAAIE